MTKKPTVVSRVPVDGPWKNDAHLYVDRIEMSDGATIFGCTQCDALSPTAAGISRHVFKYRDTASTEPATATATVPAPVPVSGTVPVITVGQIVTAFVNVVEPLGDLTLDEFADAFNSSEEWRERALTAEQELNKIKEVLGVNHTTPTPNTKDR